MCRCAPRLPFSLLLLCGGCAFLPLRPPSPLVQSPMPCLSHRDGHQGSQRSATLSASAPSSAPSGLESHFGSTPSGSAVAGSSHFSSGILFGITTRRISPTVLLLVLFTALLSIYQSWALADPNLPEILAPLTPFELTAPILGLLLVFRTNTAYERFNVGSDAAWEVTSRLRSVIRKLIAWSGAPHVPSPERNAAVELMDACALFHGWLMTCYLKGADDTGAQAAVLRAAIGTSRTGPAGEISRQQRRTQETISGQSSVDAKDELNRLGLAGDLKPATLATALSLGVTQRMPSLDVNQQIAIDAELSQLTSALGTCEKLLRTPIPLGYTRYCVRFLWLWLTLLPFALCRTFAEFGVGAGWQELMLVLAMLFIGFIFLSIEDVAVQIEEPFKILPLGTLQKWLVLDVRQLKAMARAFVDRW